MVGGGHGANRHFGEYSTNKYRNAIIMVIDGSN